MNVFLKFSRTCPCLTFLNIARFLLLFLRLFVFFCACSIFYILYRDLHVLFIAYILISNPSDRFMFCHVLFRNIHSNESKRSFPNSLYTNSRQRVFATWKCRIIVYRLDIESIPTLATV